MNARDERIIKLWQLGIRPFDIAILLGMTLNAVANAMKSITVTDLKRFEKRETK